MSFRLPIPKFAVLVLLVLATALVGCSTKKGTKDFTAPFTTAHVNEVLMAVTIGANSGTYVATTMPQGGGVPPAIAGSDTFVAGCATQFTVTLPDTATGLDIGVLGVPGYYHVVLPPASQRYSTAVATKLAMAGLSVRRTGANATAATADYVVLIVPVATATHIQLTFGSATAHSHSVMTQKTIASSHRASGSGQLQVSLSWNAPVDLDLHVETPDSTDIFYANKAPAGEGGTLDLDSNPACMLDYVNNENITWGNNVPALGQYKIRVDLWSACEVTAPIQYVVTVKKCGQVFAYPGTVDPSAADHGGSYAGTLINTLEFTGCGAPQAASRPWANVARGSHAR